MLAHVRAARAQMYGVIQKPAACQVCGTETDRLEKHHRDYSQAIDVVWLCKACHVIADEVRRHEEKAS